MAPLCQNTQQINLAFEKLIEQFPGSINIVKRLVDLMQEDLNRLQCHKADCVGNCDGLNVGTD
jgi:hypothetical protein